jgi:hypothetical protein
MSCTGPIVLNFANPNSKFIVFGTYNPSQYASDLKHLEKSGCRFGENRKGYTKGQFISWVDETSEKMFQEVIKYCEEHLDFKINEAHS